MKLSPVVGAALTAGGSKAVQAFLTGKKVPAAQTNHQPSMVDGEMFQTRNTNFKASNIGTKIHDGAQGKHIIGHNNYTPGKSTLNRNINPQELLDGIHSGIYPVISKGVRGNIVVDFGKVIGIDGKSGLSTNFGTIHSSKHGVHIVPASPQTIKKVK